MATYTCEEGYLLMGPPMRECQDNGNWTEQDPFCESKFLKIDYFVDSGGLLQKFWPRLNQYQSQSSAPLEVSVI